MRKVAPALSLLIAAMAGPALAQLVVSPSQSGAVGTIVTATDPNGNSRKVVEQHIICDSGCSGGGGGGSSVPVSFPTVTVGTPFTPGLGLLAVCTVGGTAVLAGSDGTSFSIPLGVGPNQIGYAIANVVSTTATCIFTALH